MSDDLQKERKSESKIVLSLALVLLDNFLHLLLIFFGGGFLLDMMNNWEILLLSVRAGYKKLIGQSPSNICFGFHW